MRRLSFGCLMLGLAIAVSGGTSPVRADTCAVHYNLCVNKYGNPPKVCACARSLCVKKVGSGDAGPKWNWIPGVDACFSRG